MPKISFAGYIPAKELKSFEEKKPRFCSFPHYIPYFWVRQEVDNFDLYSCCCQVFQHIYLCLHCLCFSDVLCNVSKQKAKYAPTGRLRVLWFFGTVWCIVSWVFSIWQLSPWNWHLYAGDQSPEKPNLEYNWDQTITSFIPCEHVLGAVSIQDLLEFMSCAQGQHHTLPLAHAAEPRQGATCRKLCHTDIRNYSLTTLCLHLAPHYSSCNLTTESWALHCWWWSKFKKNSKLKKIKKSWGKSWDLLNLFANHTY